MTRVVSADPVTPLGHRKCASEPKGRQHALARQMIDVDPHRVVGGQVRPGELIGYNLGNFGLD